MKRSRIMKSLFAAAAIAIACTFVSARPVEAKSKKVYRPDTMKESYHFGDGHWITSSITNFKYNKKGLEISRTNTLCDPEIYEDDETEPITNRTDTKYNKKGLVTSTKTYAGDQLSNSTEYTYKGKKIKQRIFKSNENTYKSLYKYDKKGRLSSVQAFENSILEATDQYYYKNKKSKQIKKVVTTFKDGRKSTSLYSYKKKRLSKITSTDSTGDTETEYFNKKGLVVKYVSKNDNSTLITTNTYNKKGDLIKSVDNSNGDISTRVYTYKYYKKKYIKEELETVKSSDGSTIVWKTEYTGWKKYR